MLQVLVKNSLSKISWACCLGGLYLARMLGSPHLMHDSGIVKIVVIGSP